MPGKYSKLMLTSCLILGTVILHYLTPGHLMYIHILLQALFFLPVYLSGLWFGKRGGLIAAAAISAVYLHHAITVMMPTGEMAVSNGIQILLLFFAGSIVGTYADIRRGYEEAVHGVRSEPTATFSAEQSLLVYVDESAASTNTARYVANLSQQIPGLRVTLLGVTPRPIPELFASDEELGREKAKVIETSRSAVETARMILLQNGLAEDRIEIKSAVSENTRPSDLILKEQKTGAYSAIVVGKHRLSRAEEFLFGNVAIRLARRADCPVWIVGDTPTGKIAALETNSETDEGSVKM